MSRRGRASNVRKTAYLPAERTAAAALADEISRASRSPLLTALLEATGSAAAVVDRNRQLVAVNTEYLRLAGVKDPGEALGLRPGEAVRCDHHADSADGCGTGPACPSCGLAVAILIASQRGRANERTCSLARGRNGDRADLQLRVRATPVTVEGEDFVLLALRDVTSEHRREALARAFLHDLANVATGLQSASSCLEGPDSDPSAAEDVRTIAEYLVREVQVQRALECDDLTRLSALMKPLRIGEILRTLRRAVERHPAAAGRRVDVAPASAAPVVTSDATLLQHVLLNMAINALEATPRGDPIRIATGQRGDEFVFRVWNSGAIPAAVLPRIFQRHFSTKSGPGRGQGTYAMKLFGEQLLGGAVSFSSSAPEGTCFEIALPLSPTRT